MFMCCLYSSVLMLNGAAAVIGDVVYKVPWQSALLHAVITGLI